MDEQPPKLKTMQESLADLQAVIEQLNLRHPHMHYVLYNNQIRASPKRDKQNK